MQRMKCIHYWARESIEQELKHISNDSKQTKSWYQKYKKKYLRKYYNQKCIFEKHKVQRHSFDQHKNFSMQQRESFVKLQNGTIDSRQESEIGLKHFFLSYFHFHLLIRSMIRISKWRIHWFCFEDSLKLQLNTY